MAEDSHGKKAGDEIVHRNGGDSPKPKIFVDEKGFPLKFNLAPKPNSFHKAIRKHGGVLVETCGDDVICLAPLGWLVPLTSLTKYYSVEFVSTCISEKTIVDKRPYLVKPGTRVSLLPESEPEQNEESDDVPENGTEVSSRGTSKGRGRVPYSKEDDMAILKFVYDKKIDDREPRPIVSAQAWKDAAEAGRFGQHTWESAKNRFNKSIYPDIGNYKVLFDKYCKATNNVESDGGERNDDSICLALENADTEDEHNVVAGDDEQKETFACSQSQIGPLLNTQTTNEPLLASTPFNPQKEGEANQQGLQEVQEEEQNKKQSASVVAVPVFHANVVGVVPVNINDSSSLSEEKEEDVGLVTRQKSQSATKLRSPIKRQRTSLDETSKSAQNQEPKSKIEKPAMVDRRDGSGDVGNEEKIEVAAATTSKQLPPLAAFISGSDHLDEECTQTCLFTRNRIKIFSPAVNSKKPASSPTMSPAASTSTNVPQGAGGKDKPVTKKTLSDYFIASRNDSASAKQLKSPDAIVGNTGALNNVALASSSSALSHQSSTAVSGELGGSPVTRSMTRSQSKEVTGLDAILKNGGNVRDSIEFKMVDALSRRYGLDPCDILYIIHHRGGSFGAAINFIERNALPPKRSANNKLDRQPTSSEKENH